MNEENEKMDVPKIVGTFIPFFTKFGFRFIKIYLGFKIRSKKAGKTFKNELINQGINKEQAEELTKMYLAPSQISNYISTIR